MTDRWCIDCEELMCYRGAFEHGDQTLRLWECNTCGAQYTNMVCPDCFSFVGFHTWPAINQETGEHMGNYEAWRCDACGWSGDTPHATDEGGES